jgi:hypothetical protein
MGNKYPKVLLPVPCHHMQAPPTDVILQVSFQDREEGGEDWRMKLGAENIQPSILS